MQRVKVGVAGDGHARAGISAPAIIFNQIVYAEGIYRKTNCINITIGIAAGCIGNNGIAENEAGRRRQVAGEKSGFGCAIAIAVDAASLRGNGRTAAAGGYSITGQGAIDDGGRAVGVKDRPAKTAAPLNAPPPRAELL